MSYIEIDVNLDMDLDMVVQIIKVRLEMVEIKDILKVKVSHKLMKETIELKQISDIITDMSVKV